VADVKPVSVVLTGVVLIAAAAGVYTVMRLDYTGPSQLPTADMDEVPPTDQSLVRYSERGRIRTGLKTVRGVAVGPEGRIYVAGDRQVVVFDRDGTKAAQIKTEGEPRCLAVGDDRLIYAAAASHVEVYRPDGTLAARWTDAGDKALFTSIAVGGDSVYVADAGNHQVIRYKTDGTAAGIIGRKDPGKGIDGFTIPSPYLDVAVGSDGLLRAVNPGRLRLEIYTPQGELVAKWGDASAKVEGFGGCCNPVHIALLDDDRVVTSEKGVARIKVYSKDGQFRCVVAGHESFPALACPTTECTKGKALDVAADSAGRIFVLDPSNSEVRIFAREESSSEPEESDG
jgi:hypothetical protein